MITNNAINSMVIIGNGLTAWTVALAIAHRFKDNLKVTIVELNNDSYELPWLLPQGVAFHSLLGIDERDLMRATDATFSLGTQYQGGSKLEHNFFMPYGSHGSSIDFVDFHHYYLKNQMQENTNSDQCHEKYQDYSFSAKAALKGKFIHPQNRSQSLLSTLNYSINVDPTKYKQFIIERAREGGVTSQIGIPNKVNVCNESADILSITMNNDTVVEGDFFIDCSGHEAFLIEKAMNIGYQDWSQWLPYDKGVISKSEKDNSSPFTQIIANEETFLRKTSTRTASFSEITFDSKNTRFEDVTLNNFDLKESHSFDIKAGQRVTHWHKNCISFGKAVVDFPSLGISEIQVVQESVMRFLELFPTKCNSELLAKEYNRLTELRMKNLRDFQIELSILSHCPKPGPEILDLDDYPPSVQGDFELFKYYGKFPYKEEVIFKHSDLVCLFMGFNYIPKNYDCLLDKYNFSELKKQYELMKESIEYTVEQLPSHDEYLKDGLDG